MQSRQLLRVIPARDPKFKGLTHIESLPFALTKSVIASRDFRYKNI